jgi:prepilin-type N-terminal cleavage/methylation domain-containing protein
MKSRGYSLVEVVVAAAVAAIGVAAGAAIINTLVVQEELNAGAVRAANLQEQAVALYRLGITNSQDLYNILPEPCTASGNPGAGGFVLTFDAPVATNFTATLTSGGSAPVACEVITCTVVYGNPIAGSGEVAYLSNTVTLVRPTIRVGP